MDGPETVIALSAVAKNSGSIALILLWGPSKSHSVGDGQAPQISWPASSKNMNGFPYLQLYHPLKRHIL